VTGGTSAGPVERAAERTRARIRAGIAATLPWIVLRSLRGGLQGVWADGPWNELRGGTILAANHHAWWDAYLVWYLARRRGLPLAALMDDAQLSRFPFFARHGAIARSRPRELIRRVRGGALGVVFAEGELRTAGPPGPLAPGAARLAASAGAPLRPLAIRVTLRGAPRPEAFLRLGPVLDPPRELDEALGRLVGDLDATLAATDPEATPPGMDAWLRGRRAPDRRARGFERLWR
jgi:1-acyl-sn-glycerol-3-phosphate acyltransferase